MNKNYLILNHEDKDFYFHHRVFRAHQTSVSGALAITTNTTLDVVPGYYFTADHWFEDIWTGGGILHNRLGIQFSTFGTFQNFTVEGSPRDEVSIQPTSIDLVTRFEKGITLIDSSFGMGLRFLNFDMESQVREGHALRLLGVGLIWHTAPQAIVDDIFNINPLFRYPKWMELSLYFYPMSVGQETLGVSFSYKARGKLHFSKRWFFDASFHVDNISFQRTQIVLGEPIIDTFNILTAVGTLGIGCQFN